MSDCKVTDFTVETIGDTLEANVKIVRSNSVSGYGARVRGYPKPADLPDDVVRALKVWLAGNQP
jgi:hypothetical protein